jgi:hypothetical protein
LIKLTPSVTLSCAPPPSLFKNFSKFYYSIFIPAHKVLLSYSLPITLSFCYPSDTTPKQSCLFVSLFLSLDFAYGKKHGILFSDYGLFHLKWWPQLHSFFWKFLKFILWEWISFFFVAEKYFTVSLSVCLSLSLIFSVH